ncbi:hypothetical protein COB11_08410 [Candidatus Aerophobetes bacterium]|uniref:FtsK gamma domain-containing protein n=1 Tax=Aerophobetes bacterium TaxID=2030807 RepID=A0A2A4YAI2_UNCAE|nr:MAG: hypothetical protein COB11_08410 [Candidatus Aerophobetes bacterium]
MSMNKTQLIDAVAASTGFTKTDAEKALKGTIDAIKGELASGGEVRLIGFGTFKVSSRINSQIILDENGAETLLGNGDLLFIPPGSSQLIRAQGSFIRDDDINKIIEYHCKQDRPNYLIKSFDQLAQEEMFDEASKSPKDALYDSALTIVLTSRNASTTFLQRKLKIGYARAASLMDELEERGVIGPQDGSRARKILMNSPGFEDL